MSPDRKEYGTKAAKALTTTRSRIPSRDQIGTSALWELTRYTLRHEIVDPNGHFDDAKEHLRGGGSLLVIVNHFDRLDTTILGHAIEDNLTPLESVAGVTSLRYLDPKRSRLISRVIDNVRRVKGFSTIPVIQDKEEELEYYSENPEALNGKSPRRFNLEAMKDAIEFLQTPGNVLMMAPEGTRSPDRKLLKGHEGLDSIMKMARRTALVLPVAITPPDTRRIVPPYTKVKVVPGELFSLEDVLIEHEEERKNSSIRRDLTVTDRMMLRLAKLLPPKNQGYYRRFIK